MRTYDVEFQCVACQKNFTKAIILYLPRVRIHVGCQDCTYSAKDVWLPANIGGSSLCTKGPLSIKIIRKT